MNTAQERRLYAVPEQEPPSLGDRLRTAAGYTLWFVFNWVTIVPALVLTERLLGEFVCTVLAVAYLGWHYSKGHRYDR